MNILTGPVFTLSDGQTFRQASLKEILQGDHPGFRFSSGGTLQSLAQIWLACTLVGVLQNGEDLNPDEDEVVLDEVLDTLLARIVEDAPNYELLAPEGSPRFMQVEFLRASKNSTGELVTRNFLVADQTSSPFSNKLILEEHSYCPACAAKDLFLFQKIVPGAGKGAGGPWCAGTLVFFDEGEDAQNTILANTLVRPSAVRVDPMREALHKAGRSRVPTWVRPEYMAALRHGSVVSLESPLLDLTAIDLWLTRQIWLSHRELEVEAPCISCGMPSKISISGYKDGPRDRKSASPEETCQWGCIKLAGKVPSLHHPWRETEEKGEDGVLSKGVALQPLRGTRASDLLPAAVEFFDQGSSTRAAITYGDRLIKSGGRGRGSIQVFGLISGKKPGNFGSAFSYNIPFQDSIFELGPKLQAMDTVTEKTRKRLWAATAGGLSKTYDLEGCEPFQEKGELLLKNAANTFPNFLAREVVDYEKMLQATARSAYQTLVLESPAIQTPDQREAAASSFPFYQTFAGASMSKTSFTEAFDNYRKKFQGNGLRADLRRIRVTLQGVEASSTPFSSGIFSYSGSKQEVMRDAQIVMIHLMAGSSPTNNSGLEHKEGVSFGQALRRACAGEEKAIIRAALLADAAKSSPNKFFFEFAQFVGRQGSFSCDLDTLYWDLYKILVDGDKSRATRWWVDLYRPVATQVAPEENAEVTDSAD
jgi:hypothetical protein